MPKRRMSGSDREGGRNFPTIRKFNPPLKTTTTTCLDTPAGSDVFGFHLTEGRKSNIFKVVLGGGGGGGVSRVGTRMSPPTTTKHRSDYLPRAVQCPLCYQGGGEGGRCPFVQANTSSTDCVCV